MLTVKSVQQVVQPVFSRPKLRLITMTNELYFYMTDEQVHCTP